MKPKKLPFGKRPRRNKNLLKEVEKVRKTQEEIIYKFVDSLIEIKVKSDPFKISKQ